MADQRELTGGSPNGIGDERQVPDRPRPLQLSRVADEITLEAPIYRIVVVDLHPLVHPAPADCERYSSRYRGRAAAEEGVHAIVMVEDRDILRRHNGRPFPEVHVDAFFVDRQRPEEARGRETGGIQIVDL